MTTLGAGPWNHPDIVDQVGTRLVLEADRPITYMIEGDFHRGGQRIQVDIGPQVRLVCR